MNAELVEAVAIPQDVYDYELGAGLSVNEIAERYSFRNKIRHRVNRWRKYQCSAQRGNNQLRKCTNYGGSKIWWPQTDPDATSLMRIKSVFMAHV